MDWWNVLLPVITGLIGLAAGFFGGIQFLKKQLLNYSLDDEQIKQMAKRMGYNLNSKQLNQLKQMQKKWGKMK